MNMALLVYVLCALTSVLCTVLLLRGFRRSRVRLLMWSAICFAGFALNNILLIVDVRIMPAQDLSIARSIPSLIGIALLLYGLIWETER